MPITTFRIRALWSWILEARYAGIVIIGVLAALAFSLQAKTTEPVIRMVGLALQLLGIGTVGWGIAETRALFRHPSFSASIQSWLKRCPAIRQNRVLSADLTASGVATCNARAYVTSGPIGPNATIEERLTILEKNIIQMNNQIIGAQTEMDDELRKVGKLLQKEKEERQMEEKALQELLEATGTGGVHISAIGAFLLFVGVILSTTGTEIAKFIK